MDRATIFAFRAMIRALHEDQDMNMLQIERLATCLETGHAEFASDDSKSLSVLALALRTDAAETAQEFPSTY